MSWSEHSVEVQRLRDGHRSAPCNMVLRFRCFETKNHDAFGLRMICMHGCTSDLKAFSQMKCITSEQPDLSMPPNSKQCKQTRTSCLPWQRCLQYISRPPCHPRPEALYPLFCSLYKSVPKQHQPKPAKKQHTHIRTYVDRCGHVYIATYKESATLSPNFHPVA